MIINDLLESMDLKINIDDDSYQYNNTNVPRVTHILSSMIHEDYLMIWSNSIGLYKHKKYKDELDRAAFIGTNTHNLIEDYINNKLYELSNVRTFDYKIIQLIKNGIESFKLWYNDLCKNNTVTVLGIENSLSCQWFGGTYDLLLQINNEIYLVDFKTSNHISCRYFYQLAAYKYLLELQNIHINGAIILQVNKNKVSYTDYTLDLSNEKHLKFMNECTTTFFSLVYAYLNRAYTEEQFKYIKKEIKNNK